MGMPKKAQMKIFKKFFGGLTLFIGLSLLGWIIYRHLIRSHEVELTGSLLTAIMVCGSSIYVGAKWLLEKTDKNT